MVPGGTGTASVGSAAARNSLIVKPQDGEYVRLPGDKTVADVEVSFGPLRGQLAFRVEGVDNPSLQGPVNTLPQVPSEPYALRHLPEGAFRLHAALWEPLPDAPTGLVPKVATDLQEGSPFSISLRTTVLFHVRRFEDFAASYEWRPVEPWHCVPPGLEIEMDLGGAGSRRARIPQPWQWDAKIQGEAAPRRVAVEAEFTMAELLARLGLSKDTHEVVWQQPGGSHERALNAEWTARQADLFRYASQISVRCSELCE